jgi:hypothetical protein
MKRLVLPSSLLVLGTVLAVLVTFAPSGVADEPVSTQAVDPENPGTGVVAYYFHGNVRCMTCRTIERLAHETITADFPDELGSGELTWRALNVDEPTNEHFVKDFSLVTRSLVLVSYRDGKVVRFQNLDKVWQLVRDEEAFSQYVRESARSFLDEG